MNVFILLFFFIFEIVTIWYFPTIAQLLYKENFEIVIMTPYGMVSNIACLSQQIIHKYTVK